MIEAVLSAINGKVLVAIGAGLAIGLAGIGSVLGTGKASGQSAVGTKEDTTYFGIGLVYSVLPQTPAIFGLVISFMLLFTFVGESITIGDGLIAIGSGLAVGLAGLGSGIGNGEAAAAASRATKESPDMFGYGLAISVLPQTQAIYGLVISFMLLFVF